VDGFISRALLSLARRRKTAPEPSPLLVELFERTPEDAEVAYRRYPFSYSLERNGSGWDYFVGCDLPDSTMMDLRKVVSDVGERLEPASIDPLTFGRLVEVLSQEAAGVLGGLIDQSRVAELGELVAYEAIGLARLFALAKDELVTEFYVDSDQSPVYLDHLKVGRCETGIILTERERRAIETHMDTFRGYTLDYSTPSLKNDIEVAGARLRVSLDLAPISANRFSLDVRRLNLKSFSLRELVRMNVLSAEAGAFLVCWLEEGGNITIIGETGTGKTTLMNALDERVNPRLRRVYIEDAVETIDLLERGYHQLKIKVDPFDRGATSSHNKESEIVKVLHRSPDIVILSELQSEDHSRAFYHALSAGVRGIQTFHASSVEQAIRRWTDVHKIPKQGILDLGVLVQMSRPERLGPFRAVSRICYVASENGEPRIREIFARRDSQLARHADWDRLAPPRNARMDDFLLKMHAIQDHLGREVWMAN
jgi:type IV secretory pathway ATPase VirB11/archaellum biosynthesis ATPase